MWKPYSPTVTPRAHKAVSGLARSILHLVDRQTASPRKLKAVIGRLGGSVWGTLADRGLGEETVINLRPKSKEASANAAKDQRHFFEGRGIDTRGVVGPKEEKERLDAKKRKRPKTARKRKKLP